jgi:hypothetical protein
LLLQRNLNTKNLYLGTLWAVLVKETNA